MSHLFPLMAAAGNVAEAGADTDANFENTVLLLNADGASDGGQNNTFRDVSGNGHSITRNGNVTQGSFSPFSVDDGKWSIYFDNVDGLSFDSASSQPTGTQNFTIECWFKFISAARSGTPLIENYTATNGIDRGVGLYFANSALTNENGIRFTWSLDGSNSTGSSLVHDITWDKSKWYHVAVVRNGTNITMYLDGVSVDTYNIGTDSIYDSSRPFRVSDSQISTFYNSIYLSNLRIVWDVVYTTAFTPPTSPLTAITNTKLLIAQSHNFRDNSTSAETISIDTSPSILPFSPFPQTTAYTQSVVNQGSVKFDGSGDYLSGTLTTAIGTNDFTIEMWVYVSPSESTSNPRIFTIGGNNNSGGLTLLWNGSGFRLDLPSTTTFGSSTGASKGGWYHIAVTRNSGTAYFFVNGIEITSASNSTNLSATAFNIAADFIALSGYDIDGYISNLRIVNGTAVYTADFTVPTAPLEAITNTSLLTCQANGFVDNSSNAHTITVNGDPERTTNVPFGERSVEFDGSGDWLRVSAGSDLNLSTNDFTIEGWIYLNATNIAQVIYFSSTTYAANPHFVFNYNPTVGLRLYAHYGAYDITQGNTSGWATGQWYHVAAVRNGDNLTLYRNGVSIATETGWNSVTLGDSTTDAQIGASQSESLYNNGYLSNVRIVNGTALYTADFTPPTEPLTAISGTSLLTCQNAVFQDNSGNAHAITVNGDPQASTNLPFGERSVYFDGSGDYLETTGTSNFDLTGDFTVECWSWLNSTATYLPIIAIQPANGQAGLRIMVLNTDEIEVALISGSGTLHGSLTSTSSPIQLNRWNHVAVVRSGSTITAYVNGVSVGSFSSSNWTGSSLPVLIGNGRNYASGALLNYWDGYISNVRIVKGTAVYTAAFTPPTEPLTAVSGTSLLTCQDAVFQDNSGNAHAITVNGDAQATTNIPFAPVTTYGVQQYLDDAFTVSPQGGSGYFDGGSSDYLTLSNTADLKPGSTGYYHCEFWYYALPRTGNSEILGSFNITSYPSNAQGYDIITTNNGTTIAARWGAPSYQDTGSHSLNMNAWNHIAFVRDTSASNLSFFVNGVRVDNDTTYTTITDNAGATFYVGWAGDGGNNSHSPTECNLCDVRIVKGGPEVYAASASSITIPTAPLTPTSGTSLLLNFTNASIVDATGRNVIETVGNAQVDTTTVKYGTGAMEFDGNGDYITFPGSSELIVNSGEDFTIEAWLNFGRLPNGVGSNPANNGDNLSVFTQGEGGWLNSGTVSNFLWLFDYSSATSVDLVFGFGTYLSVTNISVSTNEWHHWAISGTSGGTATAYLDGVEIGSGSIGTFGTNTSFVNHIGLGYYGDAKYANYYQGFIDDFRITKGIARYTANFTPPTKALPVIGE